MIGQLEGS